jgi:glycosyltransferase involved in cell wall biosynthesis
VPTSFLQIVIPTYNRVNLLTDTLNRLIESIRLYKLMNEVRIVILDNASTDSTAEISNRNFEECDVQYIKNEFNIGVEKNIHKALTYEGARWTWVMGDDDIVTQNAVGLIHNHLNFLDEECGLLLLNYGQLTHDLKQVLSSRVCEATQPVTGYWTGTDGIIKYKGIFDLLGFISSVIIRNDFSKDAPDFTHFNSLYDQTASILCATKSSKISLLPPGIMFQRQNNQRQYENIETGNGKAKFQTFITVVLLFNEVVRQNPEYKECLFEFMTSKLGITEPQGEHSYINTYIWFFEVFARPSMLNAKLPREKKSIYNALTSVTNIIHSENARSYINQQLNQFTA